jgi:hypothetical protein
VTAAAIAWTTPPACQGQIVETSYAWVEGYLYRRVVDRSAPAGTGETIYCCDRRWSDSLPEPWHPINGEPAVPESAWASLCRARAWVVLKRAP